MDSDESREAIEEYITPLLDRHIDSLVLGCTHYPFLTLQIQKFVGEGVSLLDPSCETVEELKTVLASDGMLNEGLETPTREFYVSGQDDSFYNVGRSLIGNVIDRVDK
jgi:glutamate racemase